MDAPLLVLGQSLPAEWPAPARPPALAAAVRPAAETYLARVTAEQQRFVDSLGAAQGLLDGSAGELAELAAGQTRLARQFLDGQRAILRHRADTDAAIAVIATSGPAELAPPTAAGRVDLVAPTALAQAPVRAPGRPSVPIEADEESLAVLIDGAFEDAGVLAEAELQQLLEAWWCRERDNDRAAIEDARTQAAAARHLARRVPAPAQARPEPVESLAAADVIELAARADAGDLGRLLDSLFELLGEQGAVLPPPAAPEAPADAEVTPAAAPASGPAASEAEAAFDRFWRGGTGASRGSVTERLLVQVLLPMVSLVAVLALVLATIG
jgi:hypothetical protein